jgi:hypothetical protein
MRFVAAPARIALELAQIVQLARIAPAPIAQLEPTALEPTALAPVV